MNLSLAINAPLGVNERKLLNIVRTKGSISRHKIVEHMNITAQAVGQITKRLDQHHLLIHHKAIKVGLGQPPKPISINPDAAYSVGIKVGRRHTDMVLCDLLGTIKKRYSFSYDAPVKQEMLRKIERQLSSIQSYCAHSNQSLIGVGVAAPYMLGGWHKLLGLSQQQADEWNTLDLVAAIQSMSEKPVRLVKDTAAACTAELLHGQGQQYQNFLYFFVDTFIGGGVVANGSWLHTQHGNAGAIASLPSNETVPRAQLLDHASLWNLEQRFRQAKLESMAAYDARAFTPAYAPHTQAWLTAAGRALAFAVVSGMAFLDTDAVVIDGSLDSHLLVQLIEKTQSALDEFNWQGLWRPSLQVGRHGNDAGALGGAMLLLNEYFYA